MGGNGVEQEKPLSSVRIERTAAAVAAQRFYRKAEQWKHSQR